MCRGLSDPCPRRCVENVSARRARQNNYYARKKGRSAPSGIADNPLSLARPDITTQQVTEAIERARESLKEADDTIIEDPRWPDSPSTMPGKRLTEWDYEGRGGWEYATEDGTRMEAAVREAGAAIASRAEVLTADRMAGVGQSEELVAVRSEGFSSAQEYATYIEEQEKSLEKEFLSAKQEYREAHAAQAKETERRAHGEAEMSDEEFAALNEGVRARYDAIMQMRDRGEFLTTEKGRIERGEGAYDMAVARVRSQGYLEALAEQRSMGPVDGSVEVHPDSSRKAVARLEQALACYPTDWIEADKTYQTHWTSTGIWGEQEHRERIPLLVRDAKVRTATTAMGGTEKYEERAYFSNAKMVPLNMPVEGEHTREVSGKARVPKGAEVTREFWQMKVGSRWREVGEPETEDDAVFMRSLETDGRARRRKEITMTGGTEKRSTVASELVVDSAREGCVEPGVSTAIHEYGHRAERVQPRVNKLMHTFVARRTTDRETGVRTKMEALPFSEKARQMEQRDMVPQDRYDWEELPKGLGKGSAEFTRSDGFAASYIGKQTSDESSEVFTVGMESVFAGRYGGLVGDAGHRADQEHRDLVLGTLATI